MGAATATADQIARIACACSKPFASRQECAEARSLRTPCRCACHRPLVRQIAGNREYARRLEEALGGAFAGGELPREHSFFAIHGDIVFYRPDGSRLYDFGGKLGKCFEARPTGEPEPWCSWKAGVWPIGERQWVRVAQVVKILPTETDALWFLHPELKPTPQEREERLDSAPGST